LCRRVDPHVKVLAAPGSKMSAPRCNKKKRGQRGLPGAFFISAWGDKWNCLLLIARRAAMNMHEAIRFRQRNCSFN
jgi:hypothetical protein